MFPNRMRYVAKNVISRLTSRNTGSAKSHFALLRHVGRRSGKQFETPIVLEPLGEDFVFALTYGPNVDWYRNIQANGKGTLIWHGKTYTIEKEEERELLKPFFELAKKGEITTVAHIKHVFEKRVGHEVDETTISRLLERHEWRKLVPHPFHPQADKEEQRLFQQNFAILVEEALESRDPEDERPVLTMAQDEACFGRISTTRRSWAPQHIRPLPPRQVVRE